MELGYHNFPIKIEFVLGSEKRFSEFFSKLNETDKIALLSHNDCDGLVSAMVSNKVLQADFLKFVEYTELGPKLISELKERKINKVLFTDINIKKEEFIREIEKFAEILIIDHHLTTKDWNSERTIFLNAEGYCASYLCYYLFSKMQNLEKIDWLVACASLADWMFFKNASWMSFVFEKYRERFYEKIEDIMNGKFWDIQNVISLSLIYFSQNTKKVYDLVGENFGDIQRLVPYSNKVKEEVNKYLVKFDREKVKIKSGWFWEFNPHFRIKSILINIISKKEEFFDKTLIFAASEGDTYRISGRRQDGKEDMNKMMIMLVQGLKRADGGGHFKAAGASVDISEKDEVKKRLMALR